MALSKYVFWECYHIRNHLDIKYHCSWENLVNTEPPAEALLKNSFVLDKGFPYLNSGLVSSPCRLVLCHRVGEDSSSKAEEESLDQLPFMPLFWWLEPVGLVFVITARGTAWAALSQGAALWYWTPWPCTHPCPGHSISPSMGNQILPLPPSSFTSLLPLSESV